MSKNYSIISCLIESIIIGFALATFFAFVVNIGLNVNFNETEGYILYAFFIVISMLVNNRRRSSPSRPQDKKSPREEIIDAPQFRGRVDRRRGIVEATARMVELDHKRISPNFLRAQALALLGKDYIDYRVIRIRAELLDDEGNANYIPVQIMGKQNKWVGSIVDGDRFQVKGKFKSDGILHAKKAFNYTMNSIVGER